MAIPPPFRLAVLPLPAWPIVPPFIDKLAGGSFVFPVHSVKMPPPLTALLPSICVVEEIVKVPSVLKTPPPFPVLLLSESAVFAVIVAVVKALVEASACPTAEQQRRGLSWKPP